MLKTLSLAIAGIGALALAASAPAPVQAGSIHLAPLGITAPAEANVIDVRHRRGHARRGSGWRHDRRISRRDHRRWSRHSRRASAGWGRGWESDCFFGFNPYAGQFGVWCW